jgi:hypothetical protein
MASKKLSTDTSLANSYKLSRGVASVARPSAPTIGTATDGGSGLMSITFTASTLGPTASSFTLTSSSGVTASGASSPLVLQEAVEGTYTYTVSGINANGTGPSSAASNSVVVASVDPGSYFPIATTTLATTASSITFSSIPATYKHLQVRLSASSSISQDIFFQLNGDTGNNYARHYMYGSGASPAAAGATVPAASGSLGYVSANTDASIFGTAIFDLLDYASTNKYKTTRSLTGYDNNSAGLIVLYSGLWQNTAAVNSLTMFPNNSGLFQQYTKASLYGIKG